MTTNSLTKTIFLRADKTTVWDYLTDPEKLGIWFHKPKNTLTLGESFEMFGTESGDKLLWGTVTNARPHDLLEYTFTIPHMPDTISTVTWTLESVAGGTRLSLNHQGLPGTEDMFYLSLALDSGWDGHFVRLRNELQPGD
ncbi:SRPBCC domain-containing protein [Octadecabacter sp. R77987]|uniref:SRPBCC family protein n=1 Tax=Octadecabacter sp. R77987 TaxID=3093874 RepID=UPI00366F9EF2